MRSESTRFLGQPRLSKAKVGGACCPFLFILSFRWGRPKWQEGGWNQRVEGREIPHAYRIARRPAKRRTRSRKCDQFESFPDDGHRRCARWQDESEMAETVPR